MQIDKNALANKIMHSHELTAMEKRYLLDCMERPSWYIARLMESPLVEALEHENGVDRMNENEAD